MTGGGKIEAGTPLAGVLVRLEQVIDAEIRALAANDHFELAALIDRKGLCLLELAARGRPPEEGDLAQIERIKGKIDLDLRMLKAHVLASRNVADLLARIAAYADGDGTYDRGHGRMSGRP